MKDKLTAKQIQQNICKAEVLKGNIPCENVSHLLPYEADVLSLNKNFYITEYEVKITRSDFKADAKKTKWNYFLAKNDKWTPNYMYYVCPADLIKETELPIFAGLIYADAETLKIIKTAPCLHKQKRDKEKTMHKFLRVFSERVYLGSCRLTYENKRIQKIWEERVKLNHE